MKEKIKATTVKNSKLLQLNLRLDPELMGGWVSLRDEKYLSNPGLVAMLLNIYEEHCK